jgi:hypothetical protein
MSQFSPGAPGWEPGGYITLPKGIYSFNFAISFVDGTAYNITDVRFGISASPTITTSSTDSQIIATLPGNNLTCYRHIVTTITPLSTDIPVEQMSGIFYLASSTSIYPFCRIENTASGGINDVNFDLSITRVGM